MSNPTPTQTLTLTSTTAPGKTFSSRSELANHYKSDWHKYNLKRREVNMTMLPYEAFNARLEAALALKKEREMRDERSGKDHLKDHSGASKKKKKNKKNDKNKKNNNNNNNNTKKNQTNNTTDDDANDNDRNDNDNDDHNEEYETKTTERKLSKRQLRQQEKRGIIPSLPNNNDDTTMDAVEEEDETNEEEQKEEEPPVIDPNQSLFDNHISPNIDANIEYMYKKYGFFIPDIEFLVDKIGFIGYCHEKIKLGHTCLYCQKVFSTWEGCQKHMISKSHAKLRYEKGIDLEEFDVFYDFTSDDVDFLNSGIGNYKNKSSASRKKRNKKLGLVNEDDPDADDIGEKLESMNVDDNDSDDDSGEWEDIDSDEEMEEEEEDGLYAAYQDEIAQHGLDITPLGELVFPDGRIIGHRGLNRYYKQRITLADSRASVVAVRRANGERLLDGRVYDTYAPANPTDGNGNVNTMELVKAGLAIGAVRGRQGKGILVPTNGSIGGNSSSYTALSLYRYKAVVKKARKEEFRARRLVERTSLPMNKMDKKANRLFNNVSVAHAPR
jgi:pre-60S factor REI1